MIDVPVRVKDALRDGRMRKNYRFVVKETEIPAGYDNGIATLLENEKYTIPADGVYVFLGNYSNAFSYLEKWESGAVTQRVIPQETVIETKLTISLLKDEVISLTDYNTISEVIVNPTWHDATVSDSFTIDNDSLVSETVNFDERMCSGDELKYGLCEGSSVEFQYFNHPNIVGRQIQAFIDAQYEDTDGTLKWYTIPMGYYDVDKCSKQFSTGIRKCIAYNKLKSDYLDAKMNDKILEYASEKHSGMDHSISIVVLLNYLLEGYSINTYKKTNQYFYNLNYFGGEGLSLPPYYSIYVYKRNPNEPTIMKRLDVYIADAIFQDGTNLDMTEFYNFEIFGNEMRELLRNTLFDSFYNYYLDEEGEKPLKQNIDLLPYYACGSLYPYFNGGQHVSDDPEYWWNKKNYETELLTNMDSFKMVLPCYVRECDPNESKTNYSRDHILNPAAREIYSNRNINQVMHCNEIEGLSEVEKLQLTYDELINITSDVTLRELQSAVYETACQFGKLDRETDLFSGVELNGARLYPAEDLYPADDLYPYGAAEGSFKSQYSKLWFDEGGIKNWKYLIITYKGEYEDEHGNVSTKDYTLQRTINTHGTTNYNMSDNWLFRNLTWTAEDVGKYADAMVEKMRNITWFPFEMWAAGLPYIETGDEIEINDHEQTHVSYVLQRQLKGIQNLRDTYINGTLEIF